jgi:hypothetical protein
MPIPYGGLPDLRDIVYKIALLVGILIVIYGVLWLLAELKIIPTIIFAIFPQIVLIIIGLFIIYVAIDRKNKYY